MDILKHVLQWGAGVFGILIFGFFSLVIGLAIVEDSYLYKPFAIGGGIGVVVGLFAAYILGKS